MDIDDERISQIILAVGAGEELSDFSDEELKKVSNHYSLYASNSTNDKIVQIIKDELAERVRKKVS